MCNFELKLIFDECHGWDSWRGMTQYIVIIVDYNLVLAKGTLNFLFMSAYL